jgi:hypothetical protein
MSVILASLEAEIRGSQFKASLGKKKKKGCELHLSEKLGVVVLASYPSDGRKLKIRLGSRPT